MSVSQLDRPAVSKGALAAAINNGFTRFAIANTAYQTNVVTVNTYVNNVMSSTLPVVPVQPTDWQDYVNAWEAADAVALDWVNKCMARLLDVPDDVINYNPAITSLLQDAITQANALIANPANTAAKIALNNDLTSLPQQLQVVETFVSGAVSALQQFQDKLPSMAADLTNISNLAIADNKADQQQIQDLQTAINQLQADINSLTAAIVGLGIADAAAMSLGLIASIVAFPEGLLTWFVMGPIVAVATTYIALDAEQIVADKQAIDAKQNQMNQLTQSCSVLATMSTTYTNLANQSQAIQTALQAVLTEWQALSSDIAVAITDIQAAVNDSAKPDYQAVLNDLNEASSEWTAAYTQANALKLTFNVNPQQLQIGMTSSQVGSALAQSQPVDLITYFNTVSA